MTIDTLRADHLASYGYSRQTAPFLSGLAEDGVVFENATSSCSHTAPSHASILTGLQPLQHRLLENGQRLDPALFTVAEMFDAQGYATEGVTTAGFLSGLDQGFEHFIAGRGYHAAPWIVDRGIEWLSGLAPDRPAFLWLHFFDVHEWHVPERLDPSARRALDAVGGPRGEALTEWVEREQGGPGAFLDSPAELRQILDAYDGQILAVDRELSRFARGLDRVGRGDDALWVVTADHGEGLGNHGLRGHGRHIYQEQLHVPLILHEAHHRWRPRRIGALVQLVDLAPTLAGVLGTTMGSRTSKVAGRSLRPLLEGRARAWQNRPAFSIRRPLDEVRRRRGWLPGEVFSLRGPRYKVIVRTAGSSELYDLRADPYELNDLAAAEGDRLERLQRLAATTFALLKQDGETVHGAAIAPEHIEELKALGYL